MQYDKDGLALQHPLPRDAWSDICPGEPPGMIVSQGVIPPGLLVLDNFLSRSICAQLLEQCEALAGEPTAVHAANGADGLERKVASNRRSQTINIDGLRIDLRLMVRSLLTRFAAPHYRVQIESFEKPEVLRYEAGGEYLPHSDIENWDVKAGSWKKVVDRDLSVLLYFNEGYEGGELVFPNFGFSMKPVTGRAVIFPSDHRYVHAAQPVRSGVRYAVVSWALCKGTSRVERTPRPHRIMV